MKLALVGKNISASMMPAFFAAVARLTQQPMAYELREVPDDYPGDVQALLKSCAADGLHGVNITYPFKELALAHCWPGDDNLRALGAVNTVIFGPQTHEQRWRGYNTDFTGLVGAWRADRGKRSPGTVAIIGAGGVGRAAAFAMAELGATGLRIFDEAHHRSAALQRDLSGSHPKLLIQIAHSSSEAADGCTGLMNCTPVGMHFAPGIPVDPDALNGRTWVFDAVYTPLETELIVQARARRVHVISGFELFLGQAFDAHVLYTGRRLGQDEKSGVSELMWRMVKERS